jgi:hypothetical protein
LVWPVSRTFFGMTKHPLLPPPDGADPTKTTGSLPYQPGHAPRRIATSVRPPPLCLPFRSTCRKNIQYLSNRLLTIGELRQWQLLLNLIAIAATLSLLNDVARVGQIGDNGIGVSLRYAKVGGDVTEAYFGIAGDAQQSPPVVGEEAPVGHVEKLSDIYRTLLLVSVN